MYLHCFNGNEFGFKSNERTPFYFLSRDSNPSLQLVTCCDAFGDGADKDTSNDHNQINGTVGLGDSAKRSLRASLNPSLK